MKQIAVIGLGYVGLPLAKLFASRYAVTAYDHDPDRISAILSGKDKNRQFTPEELKEVQSVTKSKQGAYFTKNADDLDGCDIFIVTVPTPVDIHNKPDISLLIEATELIAAKLPKNGLVIYESTVYPGCTEERCIPVLEKISGMKLNTGFYVGYSPERINPGDTERRIENIVKVTSGSSPEAAEMVDELYRSVITAGTHLAPSIKVAEAAKVIENSQRDINIAFVNELAKIFSLMQIDTNEVLNAAATKWNFLPFRPGLVGGHCIGVDPYYLAQKATEFAYHPEIILAGRRMNDSMGYYVASECVKTMLQQGITVSGSSVLVMGITFKENCPDIRNSKVNDVIKNLKEYGCSVDVYDPVAEPDETEAEYHIQLIPQLTEKKYDAVIFAVAHHDFKKLDPENLVTEIGVIFDVKGIFPKNTRIKRL
ncbi:nucleotide sugar dehydrogenase [Chryseobacterium taklimakanense]|uniref:nucleotide sugar dehydrogenase n=1 Tax=Chryseobacterium taklimakanense TaxID=536441 RepID=UPI0023F91007|nr:nucleotide sugar dehydrogenase [Chryseobacterium taklimakanense]